MDCSVKSRLIETLKKEIKGKATSYKEEAERVFIPVSYVEGKKIDSKDIAYKAGERIVNKLNLQYKPFTKSDIVSLDSTPKEGVYINIHPDTKVVAAYEYKELQEESGYYDKQVGQTTLFQTSRKSGYSESLEAGLEWAKKVFPNSDVRLVEGLIQDIARGSYNSVEDVISASKQFADKGTIKHEFGHKAFATLTEQERDALLEEGSKLFKIPRGEGKTVTKFQQVDYQFKSAEKILANLSKIKQWEKVVTNPPMIWEKIQKDLQIPKEQLELIKNSEGKTVEEKLTNFLANYSFTVEINTAKDGIVRKEYPEFDLDGNPIFGSSQIDEKLVKGNTQHYSNLTVPGGTNYTENEIATPGVEVEEKPQGIKTKPGVEELFESNPELANIGTQEQYSQYLNTIFPDTIAKKIFIHHGNIVEKYKKDKNVNFKKEKITNYSTSKGFYFDSADILTKIKSIKELMNLLEFKGSEKEFINSPEGNLWKEKIEKNGDLTAGAFGTFPGDLSSNDFIYTVLNIKNPHIPNVNSKENKDSIIQRSEYYNNVAVFEPEQIHILGSKQDIEGFKSFIKSNTKTVRKGAITPSIKGHAQFATDKGIGWFRSDEQTEGGELIEYDDDKNQRTIQESRGGVVTKTRRILEVQSDLFQKWRNNFEFEGNKYTAKKYDKNVWHYYKNGNEINASEYTKTWEIFLNTYLDNADAFTKLLQKDNNWVTFFVKSIIQDSAKQGYEKVLFPSGNTASKIEGHTTLEEFKKQKEDRIKELENTTIPEWQSKKDNFIPENYFNINMFNSLSEEEKKNLIQEERVKLNQEINSFYAEIEQLKQELERVEKEGFAALRPIFNFYENTVGNVLRKQGFKPKLITDEYGNTWNEIELSEKDKQNIKFQSPKLEYSGDLAIEEKIMEMLEKSPDRVVAKSAIGKFFQKLKQFLRDVFNSRDKIGNFIKDVNEGRFSERKIQTASKEIKFQKIDNDWNDNQGSAFEQQQRFFKRKIAELKKVLDSNKFPKYSKEWLEKKKELNELEVKVNEAILHQSKNLFLELGTEALDKIENYITGLENGTNPVNDRYMEYVIDTLDTWSNFEGTEPKVKDLKRKAFPFIKKYNLEVAKSFAHNPDAITQEAIDNDNLDIRKWFNLGSRYIGSLSDSQNILGRTIGFVIKEAQNIYSAKNKQERTEIQEQVTALFEYAKKAGIKPINIYNYFIQESNTTTVLVSEKLKDGTINPNWDIVQNTPELKRFYDFYRQKMSESQKRLPVKPGLNFIPNIQGESIKLFLNDLNPLKTKTVDGKVVTEEYLPEIVPLRYIKSIPANIKSKDLGNSLLAFVKQSHEFEQLSDVLPKVNILQEEIKNRQLPDGEVVPRKFIKASSPGKNVTVEGKDSDLYLMTESVKEMQVLKKMKTEQGSIEYGKNYDADGNPIEVKYFDTTDFVDNLLRLNSLVRIGFAPITAASNAIFGDASNLIEAIGGRFFNVKELGQATDIFFKQTFNRDSALNQILEETNYLQSLDDYQNVEKGVGQLTRESMLEYAYGMQKAGEKYLQSRTLVAVMIRKGYLTPKGEVTSQWINISEKEKTRFINETQRLNQMIHGRYSQEEAATMYQNVIFRMVSQFRKWVPSAIERTIGKRQFDERLGVEVEGTFITFGNKVLGNWKNPYQAVENMILPLLNAKAAIKKGNLSELEVYNMRKTMVNILLGTATFLAYLLLHGGDDEEKKKWRKNPWIKTTLTLLNRVSGDLNLIYSPGSITQMAGTGAPVISLIDDMIDVVKFTFWEGLIYQDWTYKTGSRKGDIKVLSKLGSVTPGVKPILDIKRLASDYSLEELR